MSPLDIAQRIAQREISGIQERVEQWPWSHILSREEIEAQHALTASLDPHFAREQRQFYEGRTASQLAVLASQAWNSNDPDGYQMARSYAALQVAS